MLRLVLPAVALALALVPDSRAEDKPVEPFNGKDLKGWKLKDEKKSKWAMTDGALILDSKNPGELAVQSVVSPPSLVNAKSGTDIYTEEKFGDLHLELEFMVPKGS